MVVVVFRSRLREDAGEDYPRIAERMERLVSAMPGFISFKTFTAADGERLALGEFESEEAVAAWREHPEHREAQRRGRADFYERFRLQILTPLRDTRFKRGEEG